MDQTNEPQKSADQNKLSDEQLEAVSGGDLPPVYGIGNASHGPGARPLPGVGTLFPPTPHPAHPEKPVHPGAPVWMPVSGAAAVQAEHLQPLQALCPRRAVM